MVDRIGDWYAFSSACYCRATNVYDTMHWERAFDAHDQYVPPERARDPPPLTLQPTFSFQAYCGGAAAPFGGLVALLRLADTNDEFASSALVSAATNAPCPSWSYAIDVFTSAGEYRLTFGVPASDGDVCGMDWTSEGIELCVLTTSQSCLFFDVDAASVSAHRGGGDRGLLSLPSSWYPCTRSVQLLAMATSATAPVPLAASGTRTRTHPIANSSAQATSSMVCFAVTPSSVCCVGADHHARALLHVERGRSQLIHAVDLSTATRPSSTERTSHVTCVALLPASVSEAGDTVVFWARSAAYKDERVVTADDDHQLCAWVVGEDSEAPATLSVRGRVHHLQLCPHDPTQLLLFTCRGALHIVSSDLQRELFSLDFALATAAELFPRLGSTYDGVIDNTSLSAPQGLSFANTSIAAGGFKATTAAASDDLACLAPPPPSGVGAVASSATSLGLIFEKEATISSFLPTTISWCGPHFVLLHYGSWRTQMDSADDDDDAFASFSLLICLYPSASVHCARLDWSLEGVSGRVLCSSEADGARVVSESRCVMLHEVPRVLVDLCRLSPPYSASARVVLAFEEYINGGYQGLAHVRAALLESDDAQVDERASPDVILARARQTFVDLVAAANWEWDAERQKRLLSAASFANTVCQLPRGSEILVDVMTRLRVLRAVRQEPLCHIPLTPVQYRVLNGDWSARLTSLCRQPRRAMDGSAQLSDDVSDDTHSEGEQDTSTNLEDAAEKWLVGKNEITVLVDRLTALGYYRLALEVSSTMGAKSARVVTHWAREQVRQASPSTPSHQVAARLEEVLSRVPDTSYVEAASEALNSGRVDLAQRLLQAETRDDKKVELLLQYGVFSAAAQCASEGADANLLFLALDALVAQATRSWPAATDRTATNPSTATSDVLSAADLKEMTVLLTSVPIAARYLFLGAGFLSSWRRVFTALGVARLVPSSTVGYKFLEDTLWGHNARQVRRLAQDMALFLEPLEPLRLPDLPSDMIGTDDIQDLDSEKRAANKDNKDKKKSTEKLKKHEPAAAVTGDEGEDSGVYALPTLPHGKPSAADVSNEMGTADLDTVAELLNPLTPERKRASARDTTTYTSTAQADAEWLVQQQRDLEKVKDQLAERYRDSRFYRTVSVVDVLGLLYEHNADDLAEKVANMFKVSERKRLFACLEVLCASGQWSRVDSFLGTPPPLRKTGFFSRSGRDGGASAGAAQRLGYLSVVETFLRYHQEERAAQFIPGVTDDAVERVQWYMSLGALVMAMEAAFVANDPGLIEQVLAKVPSTHTRVIERGQEMLKQLQQN